MKSFGVSAALLAMAAGGAVVSGTQDVSEYDRGVINERKRIVGRIRTRAANCELIGNARAAEILNAFADDVEESFR